MWKHVSQSLVEFPVRVGKVDCTRKIFERNRLLIFQELQRLNETTLMDKLAEIYFFHPSFSQGSRYGPRELKKNEIKRKEGEGKYKRMLKKSKYVKN